MKKFRRQQRRLHKQQFNYLSCSETANLSQNSGKSNDFENGFNKINDVKPRLNGYVNELFSIDIGNNNSEPSKPNFK